MINTSRGPNKGLGWSCSNLIQYRVYGPFCWFCWDLLLFVTSQTREETTPISLQVLDWIPAWDFNPILQFKLQMLHCYWTHLVDLQQNWRLCSSCWVWNCFQNLEIALEICTEHQISWTTFNTSHVSKPQVSLVVSWKKTYFEIYYIVKVSSPCFLESWWYIGKLEICRSVWTTTSQLQNISHVSSLHFSFFSKRLLWSGI